MGSMSNADKALANPPRSTRSLRILVASIIALLVRGLHRFPQSLSEELPELMWLADRQKLRAMFRQEHWWPLDCARPS